MKLTPESTYKDPFDNSRFDLTFRINLFLGIVLIPLGIVAYILDQPAFIPTLIGLIFILIFTIILYVTRQFRMVATAFSFSGIFLSSVTLIGVPDAYHFVDTLWIMIVILFAYFTLGKKWGFLFLSIGFTAIIYYLFFQLNINLENVNTLSPYEIYAISLNAAGCGIIIAFLINQFLNRNRLAVDGYKALANELKEKNQLIKKQNDQKTAMLKEIHHRVKNNLQVITSLLRLQARDIGDTETTQHFKEATDRIAAMALIHNKMYQSEDLDEINLKSYLENLSQNIIASYATNTIVKNEFQIEIEHVKIDTIIPIALLFNELISNSIKHGFDKMEYGKITIKLKKNSDHSLLLEYSDNGFWKTPDQQDSFGAELIETLVEQMNGTYNLSTENGTCYSFELNL